MSSFDNAPGTSATKSQLISRGSDVCQQPVDMSPDRWPQPIATHWRRGLWGGVNTPTHFDSVTEQATSKRTCLLKLSHRHAHGRSLPTFAGATNSWQKRVFFLFLFYLIYSAWSCICSGSIKFNWAGKLTSDCATSRCKKSTQHCSYVSCFFCFFVIFQIYVCPLLCDWLFFLVCGGFVKKK